MLSIRGRDKHKIVRKRRRSQNQKFAAELPDDIFFLIFEKKLGLVDRIRARIVCKNWYRQMSKIPNQGEFPLLFRRYIYDCKVKLTDEYSKRSYVIDEAAGQHLYGAKICASKFGWILMRRQEYFQNNSNLYMIKLKFFVYCPLFNSKLMMNLPSLNTPDDHHTKRHYTYSSNPTLSDCVFFAILTHNSHRIEINTCRIGDEEWKKFQINLSIPYERFSFECVNGLLYVVLLRENDNDVDKDPIVNSHVGTFDPQRQEWKLIKNEKGFMKSSNGIYFTIPTWNLFPVVYNNKELYLVRQMLGYVLQDVFRYDMEEKKWVEQPSLGNRVLFLGSYGSSILVDAVGKLSNLANKAIGCHGLPYCYRYSFSRRTFEDNPRLYVDDDRNSEGSIGPTLYETAWIIVPTLS